MDATERDAIRERYRLGVCCGKSRGPRLLPSERSDAETDQERELAVGQLDIPGTGRGWDSNTTCDVPQRRRPRGYWPSR